MSLPALTASTTIRRCQWSGTAATMQSMVLSSSSLRYSRVAGRFGPAISFANVCRPSYRSAAAAHVTPGSAIASPRRPDPCIPTPIMPKRTVSLGGTRTPANGAARRVAPAAAAVTSRNSRRSITASPPLYESGQLYTESFQGLSTNKISWPSSLPPDAPLAATGQGPYRPRLPPAEIRHATHPVRSRAPRRRTRLSGGPPTRHLGQRQASDRPRQCPMAPTHEQRPRRLDRRVLRRRRGGHAAQHGNDARQGCRPGVLRDHQYDRPAPHADPPCRDRGGQWTGGRRDRAVALGLRRRRQAAAGHASRGLGQVHRALGTAKRTLAHGGRRLE